MNRSRHHFNGFFAIAVLAIAASWTHRGHAEAPMGRYTVANGAVYDTQTELTWEQPISADPLQWTDAISYCENLQIGGQVWRLPTMKELQTIVDRGTMGPAIDTAAFPGTASVPFWTSSPSAAAPATDAWSVHFDDGSSSPNLLSTKFSVRCVH